MIKRRKFPLIDLTQVIFSVIFGYFTNFTGMITDANNYLTNLPLRLVFMAVSMVFIALGVSIYMNAKLVNMPMEGMTLAIAEKLGKPFARVKVVVDCSTVILALVFLHGIKGVGIGTVLAAICVGPAGQTDPETGIACTYPVLLWQCGTRRRSTGRRLRNRTGLIVST